MGAHPVHGPLLGIPLPSLDSTVFVVVLLLTHVIPWGDALDVSVRLYLKQLRTGVRASRASIALPPLGAHAEGDGILRPYAIIASVRNIEGELGEFLDDLGARRGHLWMIDDASSDRTLAYLSREGVKAVRIPANVKKPAALRVLVHELPPEIATVMVVDPDVALDPNSDLESTILKFQRSGCAGLCPRIRAREHGILSYLQALEYDLAMLLGRASLGDFSVTSGVAIYRRDALQETLDSHTLSVYAEDLENTFLLLSRGERIYYDGDLVVFTRCPATWSHWFSQRVGWHFGLLRAYSLYWKRLWQSRSGGAFVYQYFVYMGVLSIALHPLRLLGGLILSASLLNGIDSLLGVDLIANSPWTSPYYFLLAYVQYGVLVAVATLLVSERGMRTTHFRVIPVYFFYVLLHTIPVTVGFLNWVTLHLTGHRIYRDHYSDDTGPGLVTVWEPGR